VGHRYVVPRPHVELDVTGTPRAYADRVAAAGGRPLVLTGGGDVDGGARWLRKDEVLSRNPATEPLTSHWVS
jgi:hypothetical protein